MLLWKQATRGADPNVLATVSMQVFNLGEPQVYGRGVEPAASVPVRALDKLLPLAAKLHAES